MKISNLLSVVAVGTTLATAGCTSAEEEEDSTANAAGASTTAVTAAAPDTTGASMWAYLQAANYGSSWDLWPGKGRLYPGNQPHGMLLTTYMNDVAMGAVASHTGTMPAGAIIVKENYMPDSTLAAVTVMFKVPGYNADHADWFFTKHLPSGQLDTMPNGMAMEGRLPGCQNCHMGVAANDYLFTGSLSTDGG